jgi:uncharacterized repeat protein (TIGR01451 family)
MRHPFRFFTRAISSLSLSALTALTLTAPVWGEGSQQLGSGDQGLNVYLFEYNATNTFIQATQGPRSIRVNVESAGQVINVSLCGWSTTDDLAIEVFQPSGGEINYTTQVAAGSPGSFVAAAGDNAGAWRITDGNARTASQTTICNNQANPTQPAAGSTLSNPVRFVAPQAGTYEIRLYNDSEAAGSSNNVFTYFDITVTNNASTNPNPRANNGQLWATSWAFNAGNTFTTAGGYDADLYIRTPGGRPNTEFIWQLDLNNFAPQRHEIVANAIGLNAPNSRASALGTSGATFSKSFPIYLSYPNTFSTVAPVLSEPLPPNVTNLRFIDNASQDNSISPNATSGTQDSGFFQFTSDIPGTYKISIDTNRNGVYDNGDRIFFGDAVAGNNSILWDGKGLNNTALPSGIYQAEVSVQLGEYHFVAFDAETSGGGVNDGLAIWKANSATARTPALNHWDDTKISGGTSNLVGALSSTAAGKHTWGNFAAGSIGDTNFLDTWVFGSSQTSTTEIIIADTDANDFGDAPDGYGTNKDITVGGVPASHLVSTTLFLGTNPTDAELDGQPTPNANGDDANGTTPDDEDGVTFSALLTDATSYSTTVTVRNTTGATAYLVGWIDFDNDGIFEASEGATATIANNATTATLTWNGLSGLTAGNTHARFRINRDPLTTSNAKGGAREGEVEDYRLSITKPSPNVLLVKRITSIKRGTAAVEQLPLSYIDLTSDLNDNAPGWPTLTATAIKEPAATPNTSNFSTLLQGIVTNTTVEPGDLVEYRIYFLSTGTADAKNVTICDFVPESSTYVAGSTALVVGSTTTVISDATGDADGGFYPATTTTFPGACKAQNNNRGAVLTNVGTIPLSTGSGAPNNSYGYLRFRTRID